MTAGKIFLFLKKMFLNIRGIFYKQNNEKGINHKLETNTSAVHTIHYKYS